MPLQPGDKLGPYEILVPIGAGGMGDVYRARDTRLKRDVAIKVLPEAFALDTGRMARFEREAEVLASLNHPNIAAIYGVEDRALVMELVEGSAPKGPLPFDEAWKIAGQIAAALEYAHERGIIHRDLKPANILITSDGAVKLLDFGLAKAFTNQKDVSSNPEVSPTLTIGATEVGVILGTAAYMPPEQAKGKSVDKRADIWAFGVVFYELLTGDRLFKGEDVADTLAQVLTKEPDLSKAPPKTRRLLARCLEKDPKKRLRDIGEAAYLLNDAPAVRQGLAAPYARFAVAALAVTTAIALWSPWRAEKPEELKPLIRLDASLGPDAVAGPVAISPDGTRIVLPIRGTDGKQLLAARRLDQAAITPLPGTENGSFPFFSPDGQWIGFKADNKLKKVSLRGGAPVTLADAPRFDGASWGENGDIVASLSAVGILLAIPAAGGAPHALADRDNERHLWPQVMPGGDAVLFTSITSLDRTFEVVSLKTGAVKTLHKGGSFVRYLPTSGSTSQTGHLVYLRQGVLSAVAFDPIRLEVRGSPEQILADVAGTANTFDVSRNGILVYEPGLATEQKWPVVLMDSSGKTEPLVTTPGNYSWPRFSPDGKRLALQADEILIYNRQKDTLTRLTHVGGNHPVWSRDGEHLVFSSPIEAGDRLNWIRADGSGEVQVLLESKNRLVPTGLSPDGRRLAYNDTRGDPWSLPLDTADPEHPKPGKPSPFLEGTLALGTAFSPDGRYVAYFSSESGRLEVYVRPAPGPDGKPGPGKWQISSTGGSYPQWSPNGRELFYRNLAGPGIMVADYATTVSGSFSSNKPRVWSDRPVRTLQGGSLMYALAPDGKHIAMFPPETPAEGKGPAQVTFLLNFFDELRRRVPVGK